MFPRDSGTILRQCFTFDELSPKQGDAVLAALPAIVGYAKLHGTTPTSEMNEHLGGILDSPDDSDDEQASRKKPRMELEEKALHMQRAVWLNHDAVIEDRQKKAAAKIAEEERKVREAEEKVEERKQKEAKKVEEREQKEAQRVAEHVEKKRKQKEEVPARKTKSKCRCANPLCCATWEDSCDAADWLGCEHCEDLWFCSAVKCLALLSKH